MTTTRELHLRGQWTPPRLLLRDILSARELLVILGRKAFFVQYRRASLGVLWAVGLPLVQAVVIAVVFRRLTSFAVPHYPVYVFSGLTAWTFFLGAVLPGSTAIVDNAGLSSKVYFPRAVLPLSTVLASCYPLAATAAVLLVFSAALGRVPGLHALLLLPAFAALVVLAGGFALVLSVCHVYLRDTRYVVQAATTGWIWITPIVYPLAALHGWLRVVVDVNPVTGVVQLVHAALLEGPWDLLPLWSTAAWCVALWGLAVFLHCRQDRVLADLL